MIDKYSDSKGNSMYSNKTDNENRLENTAIFGKVDVEKQNN